MTIKGQFLCIADNAPPQVHLIDEVGLRALNDGLRIASLRQSDSARKAVYKSVFQFECDYAIPCWIPHVIESIALEHTRCGPHDDAVRFLAAAIATGNTFGADRASDDDVDGGTKVKTGRPLPQIPPTGAARLFDLVQS